MEMRTLLQFAAILILSMVAGTTFGIWRGYNPAPWAPATFIEVHHGAVGGLNTLIPLLGAITIAIVAALAFLGRDRGMVLGLYGATLVLLVASALITRFLNQPINAQVMGWTVEALPTDWAAIRDRWWTWHVMRTFTSVTAEAVLLAAVMAERAR